MVTLYVTSTAGYSGKSMVTMGIGAKLQGDKLNVGYQKPVGILPIEINGKLTDQDAWFIYRFLNLSDPLEFVCPIIVTQDLLVKALREDLKGLDEKISQSFRYLLPGKDIMVVGGSGSLHTGTYMGIPATRIAESLDAKVLLIDRYKGDFYLDSILDAQKNFGERLLGVILNNITPEYMHDVEDLISPHLERKGISVMGIIPHDRLMASVKVEYIVEQLGGKVLCCHNRLNNLVEHFLIGGMQVNKFLEFFRKTTNVGVIVGGDRSDIHLASIEGGAKCLVLTGDLYPNEIIVSRAEEKQVPIIVLPGDTYSISQNMEKLSVRIRLRESEKVARGVELIKKHVNFDRLYSKLGLPRRLSEN